MGLIIPLLVAVLAVLLVAHLLQRYKLRKIPQPRSYPIIGHLLICRPDPVGFMNQIMGMGALYPRDPRMCLFWLGPFPALMVYSAKLLQPIFGTAKHLNKGLIYTFLVPWLGQSLLISTAERWRPKRKLLTPTFHYDILKDFLPIFNQQGKVLVEKLTAVVDSTNPVMEVLSTVTLCTLDIICETSMGRSVHAQQTPAGEKNSYVEAVHTINDIIQNRTTNPLMWADPIFYLFGRGREHDHCLSILHGFTKKVIEERRAELEALDWKLEGRRAFLDLLLEMAHKGEFPMEDIASEVDTFMFEGHDTTSTALSWALHLIGNHPEVQQKIQKELDEVLGASNYVTHEDLSRLNYLEAVIKETLRLYPSVPIVVRELGEDEDFDGTVVSKGTIILANLMLVQRDPAEWPEPDLFKPERHIHAEKNHAFAWVPFSAGGRNCIGQRFAMLEMKTVLAEILHHFTITSIEKTYDARPKTELILRNLAGLHVKIAHRQMLH